MSVEYAAAIMVGLPRKELADASVDVADLLDRSELDVCPPYYDGASSPNAIVGFFYHHTGAFSPSKLHFHKETVEELGNQFRSLTGMEPGLYLSPYGF